MKKRLVVTLMLSVQSYFIIKSNLVKKIVKKIKFSENLIWRMPKKINFGGNLIWRMHKKIKFGEFLGNSSNSPKFLP